MKTLLSLVGVVMLLAGLLFAAQGAGIVTWPASSFMIGASQWLIYGGIIALVGLVLIYVGTRRPGGL